MKNTIVNICYTENILGHPFWPGQIVSEGPGIKARSGTTVVKFFASNDYAQVKPDQLKAYKPGVNQTSGKKQRKVNFV